MEYTQLALFFWGQSACNNKQQTGGICISSTLHSDGEEARKMTCWSLNWSRIFPFSSPQALGLAICSRCCRRHQKPGSKVLTSRIQQGSSPSTCCWIIYFLVSAQEVLLSQTALHGGKTLRLLTFLILLILLPIRAWWSGAVRWPILECFHYEFIHILLNPHCVNLQEYTPYIFVDETFETRYFKIVTTTFPCAPHPKISLESPQSPQPQPSTPSTHPNPYLAAEARL